MKRKLFKGIAIGLIVIVVAFGGLYGYDALFGKKASASSVQYYTVSTRRMNLETSVQGTGAAFAAVTKDVLPNNSGTLEGLSVKVGDSVTAGQKLFTADSDQLRSSVTTAKDNLTKQEITLSSDEDTQKVDDNKVAMDKLSVSDAEAQLNDAAEQLDNMTVKAPISGIVTAVNNGDGDNIQSGSAVLTIVDMSSLKIKVSVDELDIDKIQTGQKAQITFDAVQGKTFDGSVESISQTGTASNNVTTYDVVVSIDDPSGIKLGMNGNVNILVEDKENALVIPAEALIEMNGQDYVRVPNTDSASTGIQGQAENAQAAGQNSGNANSRASLTSDGGKLMAVKIGLQTENYIEVTEGLTDGQEILVQLPQADSTNNNTTAARNSYSGGFGSVMAGGFGGAGGYRMQTGGSGGARTQGGNGSRAGN